MSATTDERTSSGPERCWRERLRAWAGVPLPAGAFRLSLHDEELLSIGVACVAQSRRERLLVVVPDESGVERLSAGLTAFLRLLGDQRLVVPLTELTCGRGQWVPENEAERCAALELALSGRAAVFVGTPQVLLSETLSPRGFSIRIFTLHRGESISLDELKRRLVELDYDNEFEVQSPGEFAHRGGIIDIYSPCYDAPVRLEFWGDEIDGMRFFMPDSQRSFKETEELRIVPRGMSVLEAAEEERSRVVDYFVRNVPMLLCAPERLETHLRQFGDEDAPAQWEKVVSRQTGTIRLLTEGGDESLLKGQHGGPVRALGAVSLGGTLSALLPEAGQSAVLWHWQQLRDSMLRWHRAGYELVACCGKDGERERFQELLREDAQTRDLPVTLEVVNLPQGVLLPEAGLVLLSDQELFGRETPQRRRRHLEYRQDLAMRKATELEEGCLAVHLAHGICIYRGVRTLESAGDVTEVMEFEFADEARLYVPLEQASLVSRYMGAGKTTPSLSKLGGVAWERTKAAAGAAAWDLAAELLRIEAMRSSSEGVSFQPSVEWERAFAGSFPYTETPDQHEAIEAVLADMGQAKPMDRLLCGDVGYGKTEVAMRAAFRAVLNGKQVAVLVPTTVLCEQHYQSFSQRMREFPLVIESLNRFRSHKEQQDILERTAHGEVDILIGTHRLLSSDVSFACLGLLIVDEEQRFGVKDKQRLKALRANLDILTMTATPIPRTLYFSLSGIRNLSTIMTAPTNRLPVTTVVANFDRELIRQAVRRELERSGQVYILHNRVQTIDRFADMVRLLEPQARVIVAHGQMAPGRLEDIMTRFVRHEFDVLVCTTIIESGVDIPNANTIVIDRADRFGLSELYQLRGRVGRTDRQAFAYLLLPPQGALPANARNRLDAIRRYTHLGAGFKLALRDLEIRGAGNILGTEQSGHIAAVGFDLYCQLLKEAVARLDKKQGQEPYLQVDIIFDRLVFAVSTADGRTAIGIPAAYVEDKEARIECYRTLHRLVSVGEVDACAQDFRDRFGPLPSCTEAFLDYTRVRILCQRRRISRLHVRERRVVIDTSRGLYKDQRGQLPLLCSENGAEQLKEVIELLDTIR